MDKTKFETCAHRSLTEQENLVQGCCYTSKIYGYVCFARSIYKLNPNVCYACDQFKPKETGKATEESDSSPKATTS